MDQFENGAQEYFISATDTSEPVGSPVPTASEPISSPSPTVSESTDSPTPSASESPMVEASPIINNPPENLRDCLASVNNDRVACMDKLPEGGLESMGVQSCISHYNYSAWRCQCDYSNPFEQPADCSTPCGDIARQANIGYETFYYHCLSSRQQSEQDCRRMAEFFSMRPEIIAGCLNPPQPPIFY